MKKIISLALCLVILVSLAACGSSDALKGTWICEDEFYGTVTWTFNGGKCTLKHDLTDVSGTYTIDGDKVTIKLETWDDELIYDYEVEGDQLKLTATDGLAPDYDLTRK